MFTLHESLNPETVKRLTVYGGFKLNFRITAFEGLLLPGVCSVSQAGMSDPGF
jgi:hypothetical protein